MKHGNADYIYGKYSDKKDEFEIINQNEKITMLEYKHFVAIDGIHILKENYIIVGELYDEYEAYEKIFFKIYEPHFYTNVSAIRSNARSRAEKYFNKLVINNAMK